MPNIQIIDDDEDICREVAFSLTASGLSCAWATSLEQAAGGWQQEADVLVLDLWMPGVDGFQVIEALAKCDRTPRLIVVSGHDERIMRAAVRRAEAGGLRVLGALQKPYDLQHLIGMIRSEDRQIAPTASVASSTLRDMAAAGTLNMHVRTAVQSKRRLSDASVVGYEALLRMSIHGEKISPEYVFSEAIDLDTQLAITKLVLEDAMGHAADMRSAGRPLPVSVNCTPAILCSPDLPLTIMKMLGDWQLPPALLAIEITEHATLHTFSELAASASRFALRNCGISLDDFGRGGTSLERLVDLPLTELKIDKQIFWDCFLGRIPASMLFEIMCYCKRQGIVSTIEGIETFAHQTFAKSLGADCGQGFLWDYPSIVSSDRDPDRMQADYPFYAAQMPQYPLLLG